MRRFLGLVMALTMATSNVAIAQHGGGGFHGGGMGGGFHGGAPAFHGGARPMFGTSHAMAPGFRGAPAHGVVSRPSFVANGHHFARPFFHENDLHAFRARFVSFPAFTPFFFYGLFPVLAVYPSLAFLSSGVLIASYADSDRTVYVYVVVEDGVRKEYRVDEYGNILSVTELSSADYPDSSASYGTY
jgi:hypothetical protein